MSKGFASNYRIFLLGAGIIGCFGWIGLRLLDLHVFERERLMSYVERARRQITVEPAKRGDILDDKGDRLATSRSLIVLGVDPQALLKADETKWPELARLLNIPLPELTQVFNAKTCHAHTRRSHHRILRSGRHHCSRCRDRIRHG